MSDQAVTYFTDKDGRFCMIQGDDFAVAALCKILEKTGIRWNEQMQTWEEENKKTIKSKAHKA